MYFLFQIYAKARRWRPYGDAMATLLRVSTDNLYKKQLIKVWASLGARRIFLQDTPSSAPRGVCSDMPGIHELKMSENVPYWHRMHSNRSSFTFMHSYASSWKRSWRIFLVFTGKTSLFAVFASESRSARFSGARKSVYVKYHPFWCISPQLHPTHSCRVPAPNAIPYNHSNI